MTSEPTQSAVEGDRQALEALYEQHGTQVYRYLVGMLGRVADAEDVLQTVWAELCLRWRRVDSPVFYLWRIARNEALRHRRWRQRWRLHDASGDLEMLPAPANPGISREERLALAQSLADLPFKQREAVVLMALEGLSAREVGEKLAISESTVDSRYRVALGKLERKLRRS